MGELRACESAEEADLGVSAEVVAKRCTEITGSIGGLPIPITSIFVRPRNRIRLRRTTRGLVPLYRLDVTKTTVCVAANDAEGALRAAEGGARRVELAACTTGELRAAMTALSRCLPPPAQLFAHLAHERQWVLTEWEKVALRVDVQLVKSSGAAGVCLGAFREGDRGLDLEFLEKIVRVARPLKVYLTRSAFETYIRETEDDDDLLDRAIDDLRVVGIHGVYASFENRRWVDREKQFARLVDINRGRLNVVAQGGLTVHNVQSFVAATHVSHVLVDDVDDHSTGYVKTAVRPHIATSQLVPSKREPPGEDNVYAKSFQRRRSS